MKMCSCVVLSVMLSVWMDTGVDGKEYFNSITERGETVTMLPTATPPIVHEFRILEPEPIENIYGKDKLRLECKVSGNPLPVVEWSFDGEKFEAGKPFRSTDEFAPIYHEISGNRLMLTQVRGKTDGDPNYYNSGRYRCIATNDVGSTFSEKYIQIRVMGSFRPGSRHYDDREKVYVTIGRSYRIPCPPHVKGYGTVYSWGIFRHSESSGIIMERYPPGQINNHLFQTRKGDLVYAVVTTYDIRESQDIGGLRCILSNGGEHRFSKQIEIWDYDTRGTEPFQYYRPFMEATLPARMNAELNTAYTMTCGATGYPVPKISWEYQGIPVVPRFNNSKELNFEFFRILGGGYQLEIQRITEYYGGMFKCYAENLLGLVWSEGQLSVTQRPKWTKSFPEVIDLTLEKDLNLLCNATGSPRPTFEWFQNSRALKSDLHKKTNGSDETGSSLIIEKATFEDNGIYTCVASNDLDTITQSVYIKVEKTCKENGKVYTVGQSFIRGNCSGWCTCKGEERVACVSLCPPEIVRCKQGEKKEYYKDYINESKCFCKRERCVKEQPCNVHPDQRKDCGWIGISRDTCESRGCCYDDTIPNAKWCFYKLGTKGQPCNMHPYQRKECGWFGISRATCESRGCCFDDSMHGVKWCFHKQNDTIVT